MPLFPVAGPLADAGGDDTTSDESRLRFESLRTVVQSASEGGPLFRKCLTTKHSNFKHFQTMTPGDSVPERCLVLAALLMILLLLFTNVLRKVDPLEG